MAFPRPPAENAAGPRAWVAGRIGTESPVPSHRARAGSPSRRARGSRGPRRIRMKLGKFVTGVSVAVALAGAGLFAVRAFASPESEAVTKSCQKVKAAFNAHDGKAFASVFAEDADMVDPMGQLVTGRAEIEKAMTAMLGPTGALREASVVVHD